MVPLLCVWVWLSLYVPRVAAGGACSSREQQELRVANSQDVTALRDAVSCENGTFRVVWEATATVSQTIVIGKSTAVDIIGDGFASAASASPESPVRLFSLSDAAELRLSGMNLTNGYAVDVGGAIRAGPGSRLVLEDSRITNSSALSGGAVAIGAGATFMAFNVSLERCNATLFGGLVTVEGGEMILKQVHLRYGITGASNTGAAGYGGAVHVGTGGSVSLEGCFVYGNRATNGGAIYASTGSDLRVHNSTLEHNVAITEGGGIYADEEASFVGVYSSIFNFNIVNGWGGAIYSQVPFVVADSEFIYNMAGESGGAIASYPNLLKRDRANETTLISRSRFVANYALLNSGGAISVGSFITKRIEDCVFEENYAIFGGAYSPANALGVGKIQWRLVTFQALVRSNFTRNSAYVDGGAVSTFGSVVVAMEDCNFDQNVALDGSGGAVNVHSATVIQGTRLSFRDNVAKGGGAALVTGNVSCHACSFERNSAGAGVSGGSGGAILATNHSTILTLSETKFEDNVAAEGAAIRCAGFLTVTDSEFLNNDATLFGGASYLDATSNAFIEGCVMTNNSAGRAGGGVFSAGGARPFQGNSSVFQNNSATCCHAVAESFDPSDSPNDCVDLDWAPGTLPALETCCTYGFYGEAGSCPACPDGFACDALGLRYETLVLSAGLWRASLGEIDDVRACWRKKSCLGGAPTTSQGVDGYCATGYSGPYCAVCEPSYSTGMHYTCNSCNHNGNSAAIVGVVLGILALVVLLFLAFYELWDIGTAQDAVQSSGVAWAMKKLRMVPWNKLRTPLVVFQILTQYISITGIRMPTIYANFLAWLSVFDFSLQWFTSIGCVFDISFYDRLLATTLLPPACAVILLFTFAHVRRRERRKAAKALSSNGLSPSAAKKGKVASDDRKTVKMTPDDCSTTSGHSLGSTPHESISILRSWRKNSPTRNGLNDSVTQKAPKRQEALEVQMVELVAATSKGGGTSHANGGSTERAPLAEPESFKGGAGSGGGEIRVDATAGVKEAGSPTMDDLEAGRKNFLQLVKETALLTEEKTEEQAAMGPAVEKSDSKEEPPPAAAATEAVRAAASKHGTAFMLLLFVVYSSVSTVVFQTFACDNIPALGASFLRADYRIQCGDQKHLRYRTYAAVMVVLYPIGIPAYYAYLLWRDRPSILEHGDDVKDAQMASPQLRRTWFLRSPYRTERYYWEVMECCRRLLLTGFLVFIMPGTPGQASVACLFAVTSLCLFAVFWPHKEPIDAYLYIMGCAVIFMSMFLGLLMVADVSSDPQSQKVFSIVLIVLNVALIVAALIQCYLVMRVLTTREDASMCGIRAPAESRTSGSNRDLVRLGSRRCSARSFSNNKSDSLAHLNVGVGASGSLDREADELPDSMHSDGDTTPSRGI